MSRLLASVSPSVHVAFVLLTQHGFCASRQHVCVSGRKKEKYIKAKGIKRGRFASRPCLANFPFLSCLNTESHGHPLLEGGGEMASGPAKQCGLVHLG